MTFSQAGAKPLRFFRIAWRYRNATASVTVEGFDGKVRLARRSRARPEAAAACSAAGLTAARLCIVRAGRVQRDAQRDIKGGNMRRRIGLAGLFVCSARSSSSWRRSASAIGTRRSPTTRRTRRWSPARSTSATLPPAPVYRVSAGGHADKKPAAARPARERRRGEESSDSGNDVRANQDYSCMPQDETAIDQNPTRPSNSSGGANDYRLGWGTSGFYSTTDNGNHWYDGITPFPSLPSGDNLDGGGDPVTVFDRAGVVVLRADQLQPHRRHERRLGEPLDERRLHVDAAVRRDPDRPAPSEQAACGGAGDLRQPGDGTVALPPGQRRRAERQRAGVRQGVDHGRAAARRASSRTCFTPLTHTPTTCDDGVVGVDRLYVTYSLFSAAGSAQIFLSYSDDQARSWSPPKFIDGARGVLRVRRAARATSATTARAPSRRSTRRPASSGSASSTATRPTRTSTSSSRPPTAARRSRRRSASTRSTTSTSRAASTAARTASPAARARRAPFRRTAASASTRSSTRSWPTSVAARSPTTCTSCSYDNRNGTIRNSNNDVFFYKSTDGGDTWIGPTRVNNDPSTTPANRDCGRNTNSIVGNAANCPASGTRGTTSSSRSSRSTRRATSTSPSTTAGSTRRRRSASVRGRRAKTEQGNYLVWYWGAQCTITQTATVTTTGTARFRRRASQCVAPEAVVNPTRRHRLQPGCRADSRQRAELGDAAVPELPDLRHRGRTSTTRSGRAVRGRLQRQHDRPEEPDRERARRRPDRRTLDGCTERSRLRRRRRRRSPAATRSASSRTSSSTHTAPSAAAVRPGRLGNNDSLFWVTPCPTGNPGSDATALAERALVSNGKGCLRGALLFVLAEPSTCAPADDVSRRPVTPRPANRPHDPRIPAGVGFHNAQDVQATSINPVTGASRGLKRLSGPQSNETEADPLLGGVFIGDYIEGVLIKNRYYVALQRELPADADPRLRSGAVVAVPAQPAGQLPGDHRDELTMGTRPLAVSRGLVPDTRPRRGPRLRRAVARRRGSGSCGRAGRRRRIRSRAPRPARGTSGTRRDEPSGRSSRASSSAEGTGRSSRRRRRSRAGRASSRRPRRSSRRGRR